MENNYIIKDGELYHHGVKGMKWGVRRARIGSAGFASTKKPGEDFDNRLEKARNKLNDHVRKNRQSKQSSSGKKVENGKRKAAIALGVIGGLAVNALIVGSVAKSYAQGMSSAPYKR